MNGLKIGKNHNEKRNQGLECQDKYENVTKEQVFDLINVKIKVNFNGKITLIFKGGEILTVEKIQRMNNRRIEREIKRDTDFIGRTDG